MVQLLLFQMKGISCFVGAAVVLVCSVADVRGFSLVEAMNFKEAISKVGTDLKRNFKAEHTNFSLDNFGIALDHIVDVSYKNLIKYAKSNIKELVEGIDSIKDPKRKDIVKKYLMIVALDKEDFKEAVIPSNENSHNTFFRINKNLLPGDEQAKATQISFIKTMLSEIIDNPVGEARIKSLMLLYCLQQAGLLNGDGESSLLETRSHYRLHGKAIQPVENHIQVRIASVGEDKNRDRDAAEILTGNDLVFWVNPFFPKLGRLPGLYIGSSRDSVFDNISTDKNSLEEILNDDGEYMRKFLAVSYIHELGHAYHRALGLMSSCTDPQSKVFYQDYIDENKHIKNNELKDEYIKYINILKYVVPLLNKKVFDDVSDKRGEEFAEDHKSKELQGGYADIGKMSFWGSWDEMLTIFGINFYPHIYPTYKNRNNIYIVEDWINENAARHCCSLSYRIGHNTSAFNGIINDAMNDEKNGYKQMVKGYYESRKIDDNYVESCNDMLRDEIIILFDYNDLFGKFDYLREKLYK